LTIAAIVFSLSEFLMDRVADTERYWQVPDQDYSQSVINLQKTQALLENLKVFVRDNPEASKILSEITVNVDSTVSTLQSLPYIDRRSEALPSFISTAYAQAVSHIAPETKDLSLRYIAFSLVGFVALVFVVMLLMYGLMKDKTKNPFMERTLNQILGFLFGLITGVLSGQLR